MPLPQLRRVRWAVRATLTLGVAASVAANILHAQPNPVSQVIAAWPPLALLLTVELISRIPVHRRSLAAVRLASTATIAGIAAWVSYWHMAGVAARYGETGPSPYLLPLSVDGLVIVASVSLVELAGRIRVEEATVAEAATVTTAGAEPTAAETAAVAATVTTAGAEPTAAETAAIEAAPVARGQPAARVPDGATVVTRPTPATGAPAMSANGDPAMSATGAPTDVPTEPATEAPAVRAPATGAAGGRTKRSPARHTSPSRDEKAAPAKAAPRKTAAAKATATATHTGRSAEETAALAARMKADRPHLTQAAIAAELGITTQRLRQINRQTASAPHDQGEFAVL